MAAPLKSNARCDDLNILHLFCIECRTVPYLSAHVPKLVTSSRFFWSKKNKTLVTETRDARCELARRRKKKKNKTKIKIFTLKTFEEKTRQCVQVARERSLHDRERAPKVALRLRAFVFKRGTVTACLSPLKARRSTFQKINLRFFSNKRGCACGRSPARPSRVAG